MYPWRLSTNVNLPMQQSHLDCMRLHDNVFYHNGIHVTVHANVVTAFTRQCFTRLARRKWLLTVLLQQDKRKRNVYVDR